MTFHTVIAIDGPAASGKSTIGQMLAAKLGYLYLDTGCMYRAVTYAALQQGIDMGDETAVTNLAKQLDLEIVAVDKKTRGDGRHYTVMLGNQDITWVIRAPEVDNNVSQVSSYSGVRQEMVKRQRLFGARGNVVMVGRDIGTVVMPDAHLKVYITASAEERARRRLIDRQQQGHKDEIATILADVKRRDGIDSSREHSPLRPAADAIIIDTTNYSPDEIINQLMHLVTEPLM